jgi:hypothetical protein
MEDVVERLYSYCALHDLQKRLLTKSTARDSASLLHPGPARECHRKAKAK